MIILLNTAGGLYDRDTHFLRFGARDYDAEIGRWTAKDPMGFAGNNFNLYVYSANNPIDLIDLTGENAIAIGVVVDILGGLTGIEILHKIVDQATKHQAPSSDSNQTDDTTNNNSGGQCLDPNKLDKNAKKIANKLGRTDKEVRDAIHKVKNGTIDRSGSERNPDVYVDSNSGEVYPQLPNGGVGDSIGNIKDYLP